VIVAQQHRVDDRDIAPAATRPAATPALVASTITGNTLLVPVDSGNSGTSGHTPAIARLVPSPPSETMTPHPASRAARAAACVSAAECVRPTSSSRTPARIGRRASASLDTR
jgi:hypothetical protein